MEYEDALIVDSVLSFSVSAIFEPDQGQYELILDGDSIPTITEEVTFTQDCSTSKMIYQGKLSEEPTFLLQDESTTFTFAKPLDSYDLTETQGLS